MVYLAGRLDKQFVEFLTNYVEDDQNEQVADMFVNVILSFNLHFIGLFSLSICSTHTQSFI